jgi:hypothetical protein
VPCSNLFLLDFSNRQNSNLLNPLEEPLLTVTEVASLSALYFSTLSQAHPVIPRKPGTRFHAMCY